VRRCSNCGATPPADARFCSRCGAPLGSEDAQLESCEIVLWRGYTSSEFIAVSVEDEILSRSRPFRWRKQAPPPEEEPYLSAHAALVESLVDEGWAVCDEPGDWYELSLTRPLDEASDRGVSAGR
jgi:zinc-ribbon domain